MRTIGVAVPVPEPWGRLWQRYRAELGDPLALAIPTHITLLPPMRVADEGLAGIERHLIGVAAAGHPYRLHVRGTATFRPISPVVFLAVVEGISDCEVLAAAVRSGPLASEPAFPYHPHVTLAHHRPPEVLDRAFVEMAEVDVTFPVTSFGLYEHGADGVWRPQRDFVLGGPLPGPPRSTQVRSPLDRPPAGFEGRPGGRGASPGGSSVAGPIVSPRDASAVGRPQPFPA